MPRKLLTTSRALVASGPWTTGPSQAAATRLLFSAQRLAADLVLPRKERVCRANSSQFASSDCRCPAASEACKPGEGACAAHRSNAVRMTRMRAQTRLPVPTRGRPQSAGSTKPSRSTAMCLYILYLSICTLRCDDGVSQGGVQMPRLAGCRSCFLSACKRAS
jgi:hypothetical protein